VWVFLMDRRMKQSRTSLSQSMQSAPSDNFLLDSLVSRRTSCI
jgi:hypothetical protein